MSPEPPPLPPLALASLAAGLAGAAALANCALLATLLRRPRNGLSSILIQLSIADFLLLGCVYTPELWSINTGSWTFGDAGCTVFQGLDVFASTASIYLVASVALHSIATISYEEKAALRRRKIIVEEEEIRSSRHSLVAPSDSSTPPRTMHIDYRLASARVRVAPPTIFVWILATSLSVPAFTLSTTVSSGDDGQVLCSLLESSHWHRLNMHVMLAVFNLIFPVLIFGFIIILILLKLNSVKHVLDAHNELIATLKLSVCLIAVFVAMSAPRSAAALYRAVESEGTSLEVVLTMSFSSLALLATLVRPVLCISLLPSLLKIFRYGARSLDVDDV